MLARSVAWGIDIGHCAVKAIKLVRTKAGAEIAEFEILPFPKTLPKSGEEADGAIREILQQFVARHRPKSEAVAVSMPGHAAFYRPISLPAVEKKKVSQLVQFEARQMIPFPLEEVVWDYQPLGEAGLGEEMEVGLFAMKKDVVHTFLNNLRSCALEVDVVQIAPLAAYNFLRYERPAMAAMIVLDMGAENTDLIVSDGQKLWLRNLHVAGNNFTRALQKKFKISMKEAEDLKRSLDSPEKQQSDQGKKVFSVLQPILGDLVSEIQRSIGFYKSQAADAQFDSILVLGNAFRSDAQLDFLRTSLGYQMEKITGLDTILVSDKVDSRTFLSEVSSFGVAMGLALQGMGLSAMTINLLPQEFLAKKRVDVKKPFALAAAASVLLGLSLSYGVSDFSGKSCAELAKDISEKTKTYDHDAGKYDAVARDIADDSPIVKDLGNLSSAGVNRSIWLPILEVLDQLVPKGNIWLRVVSINPITSGSSGAETPASGALPTEMGGAMGPPGAGMPGPGMPPGAGMPPGQFPGAPGAGTPHPAPPSRTKPAAKSAEAASTKPRDQIVVSLTGQCRDKLESDYVQANFAEPLANLSFSLDKERTRKLDNAVSYATLLKENKVPRGADFEVLEFYITWTIDVEKLAALGKEPDGLHKEVERVLSLSKRAPSK